MVHSMATATFERSIDSSSDVIVPSPTAFQGQCSCSEAIARLAMASGKACVCTSMIAMAYPTRAPPAQRFI